MSKSATSRYLDGVDAVVGARRTVARAADVYKRATASAGAGHPSKPVKERVRDYVRGVAESAPPDTSLGLGTVVGAGAGALFWKGHRVLGALAGGSVGTNLPALVANDELRRSAACNMAQTGAGVAASLVFKSRPAWAFAGGWLAAGAVVFFAGWRK